MYGASLNGVLYIHEMILIISRMEPYQLWTLFVIYAALLKGSPYSIYFDTCSVYEIINSFLKMVKIMFKIG